MSSEETTQIENPSVIPVRILMEAGAHYGHQTKRWNPKMKPYIYGARDGVHIVNLSRTQYLFRDAYNFVSSAVSRGGDVLFVGTKPQAGSVIQEEARKAKQFFVTHRWLGGMLTNWETIKKSIERLRTYEQMREDGTMERLPKKEILKVSKQQTKLEMNLGGIKNMNGIPRVMFVVDPRREKIAVAEARKLGIKVVAITDTNCDPDQVDYIIPGNDDAIRAIRLFASRIGEACLEGARGRRRGAVDPEDMLLHAPGTGVAGAASGDVQVVQRQRPGAVPAVEGSVETAEANAPAADATAAEAAAPAAEAAAPEAEAAAPEAEAAADADAPAEAEAGAEAVETEAPPA